MAPATGMHSGISWNTSHSKTGKYVVVDNDNPIDNVFWRGSRVDTVNAFEGMICRTSRSWLSASPQPEQHVR